jgi:preprotein translocase subunit SecF
VLKNKEGTVFDRTLSAAKTGLLMTFTTLIAVTIGLLLTTSSTIKEIMTIMIFGLIFDIINTWIQNVALLRYYVEHIRGRRAEKPVPVAVAEEEKPEEEDEQEVFDDELGSEDEAAESETKEGLGENP